MRRTQAGGNRGGIVLECRGNQPIHAAGSPREGAVMKGMTCTGGRFRRALAIFFALGLTASRAAAAPYFYTITDLGVGLGPHSEAVALNDAGQAVGEASQRPFLQGGGARTDIGDGAYEATGIN